MSKTIVHLLLYEFWQLEKVRNSNHWAAEITTFRVQLEDRLTSNLSNYLAQELPKIYQNALLIAQKKTQLDSLPNECPFSFEQLLNKYWFPD
ncbi:MAG: DUF29 domain-containing protein [Cyanobacteria bacterium J06621_8]